MQGVRIVMNKNTELGYSTIEYREFMNAGIDLHFKKGEEFISTIDNVVQSTIRANGFAFNLSNAAANIRSVGNCSIVTVYGGSVGIIDSSKCYILSRNNWLDTCWIAGKVEGRMNSHNVLSALDRICSGGRIVVHDSLANEVISVSLELKDDSDYVRHRLESLEGLGLIKYKEVDENFHVYSP